ncbi:MAG: hypothetical protein WCI18_07875 [Pseudomonadota bacterium]
MEFPVALASRLFVLLYIPFLSHSINSIYLSLALFFVALALSLAAGQEGFSLAHHHLKHPKTLSLGLVLSSVLVGVDNALFFGLGLCLLAVIVYYSSLFEHSENRKRLGLRYDLYNRWVSDFLPGALPVARLPQSQNLTLKDRLRKIEGTLFATAVLSILGGFLAAYRPFHANAITFTLWVISVLLFVTRFPVKTWPRLWRSQFQR